MEIATFMKGLCLPIRSGAARDVTCEALPMSLRSSRKIHPVSCCVTSYRTVQIVIVQAHRLLLAPRQLPMTASWIETLTILPPSPTDQHEHEAVSATTRSMRDSPYSSWSNFLLTVSQWREPVPCHHAVSPIYQRTISSHPGTVPESRLPFRKSLRDLI